MGDNPTEEEAAERGALFSAALPAECFRAPESGGRTAGIAQAGLASRGDLRHDHGCL